MNPIAVMAACAVYKGAAPSLLDVVSGQVHFTVRFADFISTEMTKWNEGVRAAGLR